MVSNGVLAACVAVASLFVPFTYAVVMAIVLSVAFRPITPTMAVVAVVAFLFATNFSGDHSPPNFKDHRVIVCGASTGIGESTAMEYAAAGARIVIAARRREALEKVAENCRAAGAKEVHVVAVDFSDESNCTHLINESVRLLGGIDTIILNHITGFWGPWHGAEHHRTLENILRVNTLSYIYLSSAAFPWLEQSHGRIAVVSSMAGRVGMPNVAPYAASKHALHGFFTSWRHELVHTGSNVSISVCMLGNIDTPNARLATSTDLAHLTRHPAVDAARAIISGTAARHSWVYYPQFELQPAAIMHALFPDLMDRVFRFAIYKEWL
eukprot:m.6698 g.6698  ORF g.6698 m.6698 type:complete len:325 (+) comp4844_c0_seq1:33-1007(+)